MDSNDVDQTELLDRSDAQVVQRLEPRVAQFARPHVQIKQVIDDIALSVQRAFPTSSNVYDGVCVLLLSWKDDDLGTSKEIDSLDVVFKKLYGYSTERQLIPSDRPKKFLQEIIIDFRKRHDSSVQKNLLIVYYGGHGVEPGKWNPSNESIWASRKHDPSTVNWTQIQPLLVEDTVSDVLFILDCCYASTAGTRGAVQGSKEVLAACSVEDETTGVHNNSFTSNIIEILKDGASKSLTAWQINGLLMERRRNNHLFYTPRHYPLSKGAASCVQLRSMVKCTNKGTNLKRNQNHGSFIDSPDTPPLTDSATTISDEIDPFGGRVILTLGLEDPSEPPEKKHWVEWLCTRVPENLRFISLRYQNGFQEQGSILSPMSPQETLQYIGDLASEADQRRQKRVAAELVRTESAFDSNSTLLLISIPLPLWTFLPDNPSYAFVGYICSPNLISLCPSLSRTNSLPEDIKKRIAQLDRQHWWFKWYVVVMWISVPIVYWPDSINKGFKSLLSFLVFAVTLTAIPLGLLSVLDVFDSPLMGANTTGGFRGKPHHLRAS